VLRNQVQLIGAHLLQTNPVRRAAKMPAELGNRIEVRLLRCRRQIADHHVVDHAPAQRADLSHRELLSDEVVQQPNLLRQETPASAAHYREAVSFNPHLLAPDQADTLAISRPRQGPAGQHRHLIGSIIATATATAALIRGCATTIVMSERPP